MRNMNAHSTEQLDKEQMNIQRDYMQRYSIYQQEQDPSMNNMRASPNKTNYSQKMNPQAGMVNPEKFMNKTAGLNFPSV